MTTPAATPDQQHQIAVTHQAPALGHRPARDADMTGEAAGTPADDLAASIRQAITDLSSLTADKPSRAAAILGRLSGDLARTAAMARALPGRPPAVPAHTFAAATAIRTAMRKEDDLSRWLATILASISPQFACILAVATSDDLIVGSDSGGPVTQAQGTGRPAAGPYIRPVSGLIGAPAPAASESRDSTADSPDGTRAAGQQPGTAVLPIPLPPGRPRSCSPLQAMEDALDYRRARLATHCPACQPGARCDDHSIDMCLLDTYSQMRQQVLAALPTGSPAGP